MTAPEEWNELSGLINGALRPTRQGPLYFSARRTLITAILESDWLRRRERKAKANVLRQVHSGLSMKAAMIGCTPETVQILTLLETEMLSLAGDLERPAP